MPFARVSVMTSVKCRSVGNCHVLSCWSVTARCGGWVSARNGTLTSPQYPGGTETGTDCSWLIQVPRGHYVELVFTDLRLEDPVDGRCSSDNFVEIRDYNETGAPRLTVWGRYSGGTRAQKLTAMTGSAFGHKTTLVGIPWPQEPKLVAFFSKLGNSGNIVTVHFRSGSGLIGEGRTFAPTADFCPPGGWMPGRGANVRITRSGVIFRRSTRPVNWWVCLFDINIYILQ